ncbi:hypothetical protein [Oryza sativa Japonica Group]|uniref:Uncharacterized protein n=1 Tax=Oryza sativa subsp. japonica TaxID=39947 RepID=Q5JNT8_ORYSJ|nr:hypothetical protein [Oryza sativa Japonica Group]
MEEHCWRREASEAHRVCGTKARGWRARRGGDEAGALDGVETRATWSRQQQHHEVGVEGFGVEDELMVEIGVGEEGDDNEELCGAEKVMTTRLVAWRGGGRQALHRPPLVLHSPEELVVQARMKILGEPLIPPPLSSTAADI